MKSFALLVAIALVVGGCSQPGASQTLPASLAPSASAGASAAGSSEPTPAPSRAAGLYVDGLAEVRANDLNLRAQPSTSSASLGKLSAGEPAYIVDGPVEADGYQWYQLASVREPYVPPCGDPEPAPSLRCGTWFGWAAAGPPDGDPWLVPLDPQCPTERTTDSYLTLLHAERLSCAGSDEWHLTVYLAEEGGRGCLPIWITEPRWLFAECTLLFPQPVERELDEDSSIQPFVHPDLGTCISSLYESGCPFAPFKGSWVQMTGHLDDPAASTCTTKLSDALPIDFDPPPPPDPEQVVFGCRLALVVTAVEPTDAPAS
jgi:hypothetical protein